MKSLMQLALGADWDKLPPALQAHYRFGTTTDTGEMDIEYPRFMQPLLSVLRVFGALVDRSGRQVSTVVEKHVVGDRQHWRRTITYPNGKVIRFDSFWVSAVHGQVIEFVNPVLGLQMAPFVTENRLHYRGVRFVAKLGPILLPIPEWMVLGHTTIVEEAVDEKHFAMDFRLTHPLFGQVFRYSGKFEAASK
ncbi:DUF4166 domain-containing protein [Denitromonas ohlonensis]|uniref:DUF4166 domain-containing protein n=2 Tax=Denitromonas TaxID=139331 RepID=A0A557RPE6_9RHOO|nr:DUF4166 domain-containing protein [Denitromonas ohlonensis]TVO67057.1 DUF4166 domain-containing protein [Denitromonas ohlonensis]TVO79117.1 DUF4166 domain-containing protein [Denitromonas ohlonensis]